MNMFDEEVTTLIKADGTAEQKSWLVEDAMRAEEMEAAAAGFLAAEKRFQRIASQPEVAVDSKLNVMWWNALEQVYEAEKRLWRLFVGEHPTPAQNRQYNEFRRLLLQEKPMKANA